MLYEGGGGMGKVRMKWERESLKICFFISKKGKKWRKKKGGGGLGIRYKKMNFKTNASSLKKKKWK